MKHRILLHLFSLAAMKKFTQPLSATTTAATLVVKRCVAKEVGKISLRKSQFFKLCWITIPVCWLVQSSSLKLQLNTSLACRKKILNLMKMIERYHSQKTPNLLHGRWWNQIYNGFHLFRISPFRLLFFHLTIGFLEARILDPQWEVFCLSLPRLASQQVADIIDRVQPVMTKQQSMRSVFEHNHSSIPILT